MSERIRGIMVSVEVDTNKETYRGHFNADGIEDLAEVMDEVRLFVESCTD